MKVVILAGGLGTRISEETHLKPKPMIEIGNMPLLWHIMKIYSEHKCNDFIICCGYKGYLIKEYFANYALHMSDVTIDFKTKTTTVHKDHSEDWKVTLVDTGLDTLTGGRLARVSDFLSDSEPFCFTYGDGVGNIDITKSIEFHKSHNCIATVTSVIPPGRYGALDIDNSDGIPKVKKFQEKPLGDGNKINGGFFVLDKLALNYISGDQTSWEGSALTNLASDSQLAVFEHEGFWQPMDTLREKIQLENLWKSDQAPWKIW